jgi:hypothetical protein
MPKLPVKSASRTAAKPPQKFASGSVGDKIELTVTIDAREHNQHGRNRIEPKLR